MAVTFPAQIKDVKTILKGIEAYDPTHADANKHAKELNKAIQKLSTKALDQYWSKKTTSEEKEQSKTSADRQVNGALRVTKRVQKSNRVGRREQIEFSNQLLAKIQSFNLGHSSGADGEVQSSCEAAKLKLEAKQGVLKFGVSAPGLAVKDLVTGADTVPTMNGYAGIYAISAEQLGESKQAMEKLFQVYDDLQKKGKAALTPEEKKEAVMMHRDLLQQELILWSQSGLGDLGFGGGGIVPLANLSARTPEELAAFEERLDGYERTFNALTAASQARYPELDLADRSYFIGNQAQRVRTAINAARKLLEEAKLSDGQLQAAGFPAAPAGWNTKSYAEIMELETQLARFDERFAQAKGKKQLSNGMGAPALLLSGAEQRAILVRLNAARTQIEQRKEALAVLRSRFNQQVEGLKWMRAAERNIAPVVGGGVSPLQAARDTLNLIDGSLGSDAAANRQKVDAWKGILDGLERGQALPGSMSDMSADPIAFLAHEQKPITQAHHFAVDATRTIYDQIGWNRTTILGSVVLGTLALCWFRPDLALQAFSYGTQKLGFV